MVVLGGDGVRDSVQLEQAKTMVRLRSSGASYNEDEVHLKFRPWPCRAERGGKSDGQGWIWETRFIPKIQEDRAELVARFAKTRCTGAMGIPRRSSVERRQDPDVDAFIVLALKRRREYVREARVIKKREKVHKVDQKGVETYRETMMPSSNCGGVVASVFEQPGSGSLGLWRGTSAAERGYK
jgi:hypothetical protein